MPAKKITPAVPVPETPSKVALLSVPRPRLLTDHQLDYFEETDARARTITVVLTQILEKRPLPHSFQQR